MIRHPIYYNKFVIQARVGQIIGECEITGKVSDGEVRTFKAGDAILGEDTKGKGHVSWVSSETDVLTVVVQLL